MAWPLNVVDVGSDLALTQIYLKSSFSEENTYFFYLHVKDDFTVVCLITWPMEASEIEVELAFM